MHDVLETLEPPTKLQRLGGPGSLGCTAQDAPAWRSQPTKRGAGAPLAMLGMSLNFLLRRASASLPSPSRKLRRPGGRHSRRSARGGCQAGAPGGWGRRGEAEAQLRRQQRCSCQALALPPATRTAHTPLHCSLGEGVEESAHRVRGGPLLLLILGDQLRGGPAHHGRGGGPGGDQGDGRHARHHELHAEDERRGAVPAGGGSSGAEGG